VFAVIIVSWPVSSLLATRLTGKSISEIVSDGA